MRGHSKNRMAIGHNGGGDGTPAPQPDFGSPFTGRYLVLAREGETESVAKSLKDKMGFRVARSSDFEAHAISEAEAGDATAISLDKLSVLVVQAPEEPGKLMAMAEANEPDSTILAVEPERFVFATVTDEMVAAIPAAALSTYPTFAGTARRHQELQAPISTERHEGRIRGVINREYLLGFRDALDSLIQRSGMAELTSAEIALRAPAALAVDESQWTWGLQAIKAHTSQHTGRGIGVCVLDTGLDTTHPDFVGRETIGKSFVPGASAKDGNGHGTHCIGTSCGPVRPGRLPRYGIACESSIYYGKVLSDSGSGRDGWILEGINWAIASKCRVVSMSLGAGALPTQPHSEIFETVARRAMNSNTLIVAAAGNESSRPNSLAPVGHPANCPSILAVGALDQAMQVAWFSCQGMNPAGGQIDIAAPGVDVYSSYLMPSACKRLNGTSMATPHVAGVVALMAQAFPWAMAWNIWAMLMQNAVRLNLPSTDVGIGLVQAP